MTTTCGLSTVNQISHPLVWAANRCIKTKPAKEIACMDIKKPMSRYKKYRPFKHKWRLLFSHLEIQCIYLEFLGFTPTQTAKFMSLHKHTVRCYINEAKRRVKDNAITLDYLDNHTNDIQPCSICSKQNIISVLTHLIHKQRPGEEYS